MMKLLEQCISFTVPAYLVTERIINNPETLKQKGFVSEIFYKHIPLTFFFFWAFSLLPIIGPTLYIIVMLAGAYLVYKKSEKHLAYKNTLDYFIILNIGFLGVRSFVGHTILSETVATSIGWETSPFQIELAFYHLGLAVGGIIYIWRRSIDMAIALVVSKSIFLFGAMGVHLYDVITVNNYSVGNIGIGIIYGDLILPVLMLYLLYKILRIPVN